MDFDFSDDQEQLRDAVRKWVDKCYSFERHNATVKAGGFSRDAFNEIAELGLCGLYVPDTHDGMGMARSRPWWPWKSWDAAWCWNPWRKV